MLNEIKYFLLWLLLVTGSATAFSVNYQKVFSTDWTEAERYVREHHEDWEKEFDLFGVDSRMAEAVVFPELIRYSMWKDEIERAAVNGLYISKGREGANFSIGRFQMKPSFAEEVEQAWNASPLAKEYGFSFNLADNNEARRSRVRRLSTEEGQCRYLVIFIRLQQQRLPQLQKVSKEQQVRLLATAYNRSFSASWQSLCKMQHERHFHTDVIKTRSTRFYCYAAIAAQWFSKKVSRKTEK
ncbi:MAG: hypothetical protein E7107_08810 [Prevotella sp.]|nr:hypothetical protein [Prevotella sp.]